jgi:hypothetical protein
VQVIQQVDVLSVSLNFGFHLIVSRRTDLLAVRHGLQSVSAEVPK